MKVVIQAGTASLALPARLEGDALMLFKSEARRVLGNAEVQRIILQFDAVSYLDSMALGALLLLRERAQAQGQELALAGLQPQVRGVFTLANLHRLFDIR